jgi:hypothetical protein
MKTTSEFFKIEIRIFLIKFIIVGSLLGLKNIIFGPGCRGGGSISSHSYK